MLVVNIKYRFAIPKRFVFSSKRKQALLRRRIKPNTVIFFNQRLNAVLAHSFWD